MSATLNCCNSCATVETVNVPGGEGSAGIDGTDGVNAFTTLTANFTIPAEGVTDNALVTNSSWMVIGQILIIGEGIIPSSAPNGWAHFQVIAIPSATSVTLDYLNYTGDTADGQVLASGATVSPAGMIGPAGP